MCFFKEPLETAHFGHVLQIETNEADAAAATMEQTLALLQQLFNSVRTPVERQLLIEFVNGLHARFEQTLNEQNDITPVAMRM
jgi:hypothetical protein